MACGGDTSECGNKSVLPSSRTTSPRRDSALAFIDAEPNSYVRCPEMDSPTAEGPTVGGGTSSPASSPTACGGDTGECGSAPTIDDRSTSTLFTNRETGISSDVPFGRSMAPFCVTSVVNCVVGFTNGYNRGWKVTFRVTKTPFPLNFAVSNAGQ